MSNHPWTISNEIREKILEFHTLGLNNTAIAKKLSVSDAFVGYFIRSRGLLTNGRRGPEMVDDHAARCKSCKKIFDIEDFALGRNPGREPHRLSKCKDCWNAAIYRARNKDLWSQIKYKRLTLRNRAKRESVQFELSAEFLFEMWNSQKGLCFYTDVPLTAEAGTGRKHNSMSIDRLICDEGYVPGNVVLCADRINTMKQNATIEEMERWMPEWHRRIVKFLGNGYDSSCKKI